MISRHWSFINVLFFFFFCGLGGGGGVGFVDDGGGGGIFVHLKYVTFHT